MQRKEDLINHARAVLAEPYTNQSAKTVKRAVKMNKTIIKILKINNTLRANV